MTQEDLLKVMDKNEVECEVEERMLYEILDGRGDVIFVGVGPLKNNLKQHMPGGWFPLNGARYYRSYCAGEREILEMRKRSLIEDYEQITGTAPKYNRRY